MIFMIFGDSWLRYSGGYGTAVVTGAVVQQWLRCSGAAVVTVQWCSSGYGAEVQGVVVQWWLTDTVVQWYSGG